MFYEQKRKISIIDSLMKRAAIQIRKATPRHLCQIKKIADANRQSIGFVLRPALLEAIQRHELFVAIARNGRILGFVNFHHRLDEKTTIYELCVKDKHRGNGLGRRLIEAVAAESKALGKQQIQLKCPIALEANRFYSQVGFQHIAVEAGKKRRLNVWRLQVE